MSDYYLLLGLAVAVVAWMVIRNGTLREPNSLGEVFASKPASRRDELRDARRRIRRQLEILESSARRSDYNIVAKDTAQRLRAILAEIEAELKTLPPN